MENIQGRQLIHMIASNTGLPISSINKELSILIKKAGLNIENINIDQLRPILAKYLQETLLNAKQDFSS